MSGFKVIGRSEQELHNRLTNSTPNTSLQPFYAKVTGIMLTGNAEHLGKISFIPLENSNRSNHSALPFSSNLKMLPLVGEIVRVYPSPDKESHQLYTFSANTQNISTTNIVDSGVSTLSQEREDINPVTLYPGDFILEGRNGQSLRFTNNSTNDQPWTGPTGKGLTILSTGQPDTEDSRLPKVEDINADPSSIYLVESSTIPLEDTNERKSYTKESRPLPANEYSGSQVIINSDRVYLNSKEDHLLLSAQNMIGLSGQHVHIDTEDSSFVVKEDSIKVSAKDDITFANEELEITLSKIVSLLKKLAQGGNTTSGAGVPTGPNVGLLAEIEALSKNLTSTTLP